MRRFNPNMREQAATRNGRAGYEIKNAAGEGDTAAEVLVYDEIGYWGITAADFVKDLTGVTAKKMTLRISSPGGEVFDGIAIYNAIKMHPAYVVSQIDGLAASIASLIALAGDEVQIGEHAAMMIHDASGVAIGNAADMTQMAEMLDKASNNIASAYAKKAPAKSTDEWRDAMRDESWFYGQEAVDAGLADKVIGDGEAAPKNQAPRVYDLRAAAETWGWKHKDRVTDLADSDVPQIEDTAVGPHSTATEEGVWDANANTSRLDSPLSLSVVKQVYSWYDGDQVDGGTIVKGACKLPHHFVSADGTPGAASAAGVRNALSRLPQTKGISDAERATIERHLNAHLDNLPSQDNKVDEPAPAQAEPEPTASVASTEPTGDTVTLDLGTLLTRDLLEGAIQQAAEHDTTTVMVVAGTAYDAEMVRSLLLGEILDRPADPPVVRPEPARDDLEGAIQLAAGQDANGALDDPTYVESPYDSAVVRTMLMDVITDRPAEPQVQSSYTHPRSISASELADALREALQ